MDIMLDFDQLQTPVWIYDTVNFRIHWGNKSALALWEADSLEELTARDFSTDASDAVYQTLLSYLDEFRAGRNDLPLVAAQSKRAGERCVFAATLESRSKMVIWQCWWRGWNPLIS